MAKIKVIVNGAKGKMGKETSKAVLKEADLELVAQLDLGDNLAEAIKKQSADVVVDFTHPDSAMSNASIILNNGAHAVIGTTGLTDENLEELHALCKKNKVNCLVAPNFAIGAVLMMQFAKEAAKHMGHSEIIELHHDKKVDKPSGTAIKTVKLMKESLGDNAEIPVHSVRLPGLVAHQEVIFGGVGQTLRIRHDSISRTSFMPGVIMAIRKVRGLKGFVYGLENIL